MVIFTHSLAEHLIFLSAPYALSSVFTDGSTIKPRWYRIHPTQWFLVSSLVRRCGLIIETQGIVFLFIGVDATYWDILRLGSCQTYQLRMSAALRGFYVFSQGVLYCFHALFIAFGLIGKGIHTCRRTFEFYNFRSSATPLVAHFWVFDIWLSATLWSDSLLTFSAEGVLTINTSREDFSCSSRHIWKWVLCFSRVFLFTRGSGLLLSPRLSSYSLLTAVILQLFILVFIGSRPQILRWRFE